MKLNVQHWGHGPVPLLLLHGFSRDARMWNIFRAAWSPRFSVTAVDLPGHGGSTAPSDMTSFCDVVDAVAAVMRGPSAVVGYSLGGRIALGLALRHPGLVTSLVMDGASPGIEDAEERERRIDGDESWARMLERQGMDAFADAWEEQPVFGGEFSVEGAVQRREQDPHALAAAMRCLGTGSMASYWDEVERIRCPVLLLNGMSDAAASTRNRRMHRLLPGSVHEELPGFHLVHATSTERWGGIVSDFIRSHHTGARTAPEATT